MRHGVHPHRAVIGLAEGLGLLPELVVRGRDEVVPGEESQLPFLSIGGGLAEREPGGHAGRRPGGRGKEPATGHRTVSILVHADAPSRVFESSLRFSRDRSDLVLTPSGTVASPPFSIFVTMGCQACSGLPAATRRRWTGRGSVGMLSPEG